MDTVRFGVVGLGNMGTFHADSLQEIKGATLTAVCDPKPIRTRQIAEKHGARSFTNYVELLDSGIVDAVIVATPHLQHPQVTLAAFKRKVHVLCEKPIAVTVREARQVSAAALANPQLRFGVVLQQRTLSIYRKLRDLVINGELGQITRMTWIVTDWFRTWAYYGSGGWRATWAGEGGGVLINQCPHNLDLLLWLTGLTPSRITAVGYIGKTHPIEVEDEVSAILEYPGGAIGHFMTSTGEAPGTNRLEICGDRGKIVAEHGRLHFSRTRHDVPGIREKSPEPFATVETWTFDVPHAPQPLEGHKAVMQNFVNAIAIGEPLIASAPDGVAALELGNAMQMAALTRQPVELPLDADAFDRFLLEMKSRHGGRKSITAPSVGVVDMGASFAKP